MNQPSARDTDTASAEADRHQVPRVRTDLSEPRRGPAHRATLPSRRPAVLAGVAVVLLAVGVTSVIALARGSDHQRRAATDPAAGGPPPSSSSELSGQDTALGTDDQTVTWLNTALSRNAPLAVPSGLVARLRADGFRAVANVRTVAAAGGPERWLVAPVRGADALPAALSARAIPVARIGTADATEVRYLPASSDTAHSATVLEDDLRRRISSDGALADNPALRTTDSIRTVLRNGGLDTRAAALLALLAGNGPVRLLDLPTDKVEAAVSRPSRTIVLAADSPAAAAQIVSAVDMLPLGQRPASARTAANRTTLVWHVAVDPVRTVS